MLDSYQAENVEKLCQHFRLSEDPHQWRAIAFCLSLLPFKSSVFKHFSFHGCRNLGNPETYYKKLETEPGIRNLATYVPFPGNLPGIPDRVKSGTTKLYHIVSEFPFQVSGNPETSENQWKPGIFFCPIADDLSDQSRS